MEKYPIGRLGIGPGIDWVLTTAQAPQKTASPLRSKVALADSVEDPLEASPLCSKVALADSAEDPSCKQGLTRHQRCRIGALPAAGGDVRWPWSTYITLRWPLVPLFVVFRRGDGRGDVRCFFQRKEAFLLQKSNVHHHIHHLLETLQIMGQEAT